MKVTIVRDCGGHASLKNDWEVHAAGCAHLKRGALKAALRFDDGFDVEAASQHEVVDEIYGPQAGGFYEESPKLVDGEWVPSTWEDGYVQGFHFAPCVKLPYDTEVSV